MVRNSAMALVFAVAQVAFASAVFDQADMLQHKVEQCSKFHEAEGPASASAEATRPESQPSLKLEAGSRVEIKIENGKMAGKWVPASVDRERSPGFYDVRVELGPSNCYFSIIPGLRSQFLRRPTDSAKYEKELRFYSEAQTEAKQAVDGLEFDAQKRVRERLLAKGMSKQAVKAKMEEMEKSMQRKKAAHASCPPGYAAAVGDVRGGNQFSHNATELNKQDAIALCAEDCSKRDACKSFEWSPGSKVCNLNRVPEPDRAAPFLDYIFCKRAKTQDVIRA
uniref:Apple domain-containing protein n=1 Tax=Alexandrium catenella TaxID=2925 RepID=A0A7S1QH44_ALECA